MDTSKQVSVPAPAPQAPPATTAPAAPPASAAPAPLDFINKSSGGGMGFSKRYWVKVSQIQQTDRSTAHY
ncbi:hypothetical protein ACKVWC_011463 [Pyricularia oryzae]